MKEREENSLPQDKDRHLDIPSEARRDKHINFLEVEEESAQSNRQNRVDDETKERQRQWHKGIEEGKKARGHE